MKVGFLANSFHITKTKSADFFIDFLRNAFGDVTIIPHKETWAELPKRKWDLIVVWQKRYSPEELEAFGADRIVLVPMYDDTPLDDAFWKKYRKFKVLCFSSTLERALLSYGLSALGARYFPELPGRKATLGTNDGLRGFFWQRVTSIDWALIKRLIGKTPFSHLQIHWTPDIHSDLRSPLNDQELSTGEISVSSWIGNREEYLDRLSQSNVYFASRTAEGIGMSFIEAMALGLCVVAPGAPTMNEYIEDGVNGLLYDPHQARPLDFSRVRELGCEARAYCEAGRKAWLESLPRIRAFLEELSPGYRPRSHPGIAIRGRSIAYARKIYRFMKRTLAGHP